MEAAASTERYEEAAHWRDAVQTVEALRDRQQKMATAGLGDRDGFGVRVGARGAAVVVFQMRGGRVVDRVELWSEGAPLGAAGEAGERPGGGLAAREAEVVAAALSQFYGLHVPPPEVHVPLPVEDAAAIEEWLSGRAGRRVRLMVPRRGDKRSLLELATRNARVAYETRGRETTAGTTDALEMLRLALQLPATPRRIECFDISTFQGAETVASMVVCADGRMTPREYRKFRIRLDEDVPLPSAVAAEARAAGPGAAARILDDFKSMRQVVRRRYRALAERGGPMPDLIVVDGGKGQLGAAYAALAEVGLDGAVAIGLAKQEELVFTRDSADAIAFPPASPALRLLQRIRDEAHRFAVTYHRQARSQRDLRSALDDIAGVGPRRRTTLLRRFGSVAGVRRATREELTAVVGAKAADAILVHFAGVASR
jgi:excinuclease ABC subunit C